MSTEFKGTQGKWFAFKPEASNGFVYVNNSENTTGSIATCYNEEAEADAKLIAASPDLFSFANEAIELLTKLNNVGYVPEEFKIELASAFINGGIAIQKATE